MSVVDDGVLGGGGGGGGERKVGDMTSVEDKTGLERVMIGGQSLKDGEWMGGWY